MGSVVVVPGAPLLLPEYVGRQDVGVDLRQRAVAAIRSATDHDGVSAAVLVVATDREPRGTRPPLGRRVGEHLLALAAVDVVDVVTVGWDAGVEECRGLGEGLAREHPGGSVVVVADGSARRGEKAPGHLDERSFGVDNEIVAALEAADSGRLLALDPGLCADLLVHGRAPLQVLAGALGDGIRHVSTELSVQDPLGVLWVVAGLRPV